MNNALTKALGDFFTAFSTTKMGDDENGKEAEAKKAQAETEAETAEGALEIEKTLSYRSDYSGSYYAVKDRNILLLGYDLPADVENETHDLNDRYALFITRGYDDIEFQLLDEGITTSEAQEKALDLVENNRNNVMRVGVGIGIAKKFAGRNIFKPVATFAYMGKSDEGWKEVDLTFAEDLEKARGSSEAQSILLPTSRYSAAQAKAWLKSHGKKSSLDTTENFHRARQFDPSQCSSTPKTITMGKGIKAVICVKKSGPREDTKKDDAESGGGIESVFAHEVQIKSASSFLEKGLVYGIVYSPNVKDTHGDWTSADEIERAAHNFLPAAKSDWTNINHDGNAVPDVDVVESYIAPVDFTIAGENVSKGSWVIVSRVNNQELKESIQKGEVTGYSLEGTARKVDA